MSGPSQMVIENPNEAPEGFYAIPKNTVNKVLVGNICNECDWCSECQKEDIDISLYGHKCMPYITISSNGMEIQREDGASVIFKRNLK